MIDMGRFEEQLNTNGALRQQFLRDPVAVFRRMGLWLSPAQQLDLRRQVAQVNLQRPTVPSAYSDQPAIGTVRLQVANWHIPAPENETRG
jgi:hypothetical protein